GEVIRYVSELYGSGSVGQIVTFGTMAAKAVIRDVARVHGKPFALGERIVREIPDRLHVTLTDALRERQNLGRDMQTNEDIREIVDRALKLEGLVRNISRHPGGTVITPNRLDAVVPVYTEGESSDLISQFDKQDIEDIGVVKFDFLGLKTVTAISNACATANSEREKNNQPPLHPSEFPLDDEMVFEMLREAKTVGIFQLESRGMRRVLKDLRPDSLEDLTALLALFRPGPIQSGVVDLFVRRKHGKEMVDYLHPLLESVLKKSYGVMVYQEDVMTVARELAGFSLGEADELRRAMAKKIRSEMVSFRNQFVNGCIENNVEESIASSIFDDIEKFAEYAFNRAHSVGYAVVAYQTAYLKAHYPAEYLAALATCDIGDRETVREIVDEARRMGLKLEGPCVNLSKYEFTGTRGRFVIGLGAIKGLPTNHARSIEEAREEGPFESLIDLCIRSGFGMRQRKILESLIRCGCLDSVIDETAITRGRPKLEAQLEDALETAEVRASQASQPFDDLFGISEDSEVVIESREFKPKSMRKALAEEQDRLGFYVSGHPMSTYREELDKVCTHKDLGSLLQAKNRQIVAGMVKSCRVRDTRSGRRMLDVLLEDEEGSVELGVFDSDTSQFDDGLKEGDLVVVECSVVHDKDRKDSAIRVRALHPIADFRIQRNARIEIDVSQDGQTDGVLNLLHNEVNDLHRNGCRVIINYWNEQYSTSIELDGKLQLIPTEELLDRLGNHLGTESIRVSFP
ncbi:MAG: DNA polymerase III subunit alpha, partial [Gammaproteobacteria bacterium]|nr:DNA polymerase III subunit alpha [Gammaproteobacteria bacterium]